MTLTFEYHSAQKLELLTIKFEVRYRFISAFQLEAIVCLEQEKVGNDIYSNWSCM